VLTRFQDELNAGLPNLKGTRIVAGIPVRQYVVDEILASVTTAVTVDLQDFDVLMIRASVLSFKATILRVEPQMRVVLGISSLMRLAIWPFRSSLPPFVTMSGGEITVDLAAAIDRRVPQYRPLIQYLHLVQLNASKGLLSAIVEFRID
jgi:hypothetical protein